MNKTVLIAIGSFAILSSIVHASPWVAVDCVGQTQALMERVVGDESIALTPDGKARLSAHSLAVCSGDAREGVSTMQTKENKGFFDFGEDEERGKKAGNKRLNKY